MTNIPLKEKMLSWKYGTKKESKSLEERILSANKSFMTNNFLIKKSTFNEIKLDERIVKYGHEDTLFGFELKKRGITIEHIQNPVLNGDIENNIEFLKKTKNGIINLIYILKYLKNDKDFINDVTILKFHNKIISSKLYGLIYMCFILNKPLLKFLFSIGIVNLRLFNFYKLGLLMQNYKRCLT
ncbi:MAG: hypothetical protein IMY72_04360 [Bacteroidetes bacterium]|nr:hypothetical protein [Bacteroidota bacterium]